MIKLHYAEAGPQVTTSTTFVPMTNLTGGKLEITHPASSGSMLVTLSVPNANAVGHDYPGVSFGLMVNGTLSRMIASETSETMNPGTSGQRSSSITLFVGGGPAPITVQAVWMVVGRGTTAVIPTYASLSAVPVDGLF